MSWLIAIFICDDLFWAQIKVRCVLITWLQATNYVAKNWLLDTHKSNIIIIIIKSLSEIISSFCLCRMIWTNRSSFVYENVKVKVNVKVTILYILTLIGGRENYNRCLQFNVNNFKTKAFLEFPQKEGHIAF